MDHNTLPFYLSASGLSLMLGLSLLGFARFNQATLATRSSASALFVLGAAFLLAGIGTHLPRWATVVGTNMMTASACVLFHTGLAAILSERKPRADRFGWTVVALSVIPFGYWGLIEPNGHYRSAVFSLAVVAINARTAWQLLRAARSRLNILPVWFLAGLFSLVTLWMLTRGIWLLVEPDPTVRRGENPTQWLTVLGYMVTVSLVTTAIIWMEIYGLKVRRDGQPPHAGPNRIVGKKMAALWSFVVAFLLASGIGLYLHYHDIHREQYAQTLREARIANDAFVEHTERVVNQVDSALRAVRGYYSATHSIGATENFIATLNLDRTLLENVWLIDAGGEIFLPGKDRHLGPFALQRDYFALHRDATADLLHIAPVQRGQVTGKYQFRVSRRLTRPEGAFAGVILIPVEPRAFAEHYRRLIQGNDSIATLIGTQDRKIRARHPEPDSPAFDRALDTPLWEALAQAPTGVYRHRSAVDGIARQFVYRAVGDLPLVMVTGFSDADVAARVAERLRLIALAVLASDSLIVMLAFIVTLTLQQRAEQERYLAELQEANRQLAARNDEQDRFMSMLRHELKTPLAVIRMALGPLDLPKNIRDRVARSIGDMKAIIERSLQADRLDHGVVGVSPTAFPLAALIDDIVQADRSPERIVIEHPGDIVVSTDRQLLGLILGNLVDNALKYGIGDVHLVIGREQRAASAGLRIEVANVPGPAGMPDPAQVFKKYYRAPGAHGKTGSGLGLHIAEGMAHKLDGTLAYLPENHTVKFALWIPT